jgi:hypothetical protein
MSLLSFGILLRVFYNFHKMVFTLDHEKCMFRSYFVMGK